MSSLIVETGSKVPNANTYCDVAFADLYADSLGNVHGWSGRKARIELVYASNPSDGDTITLNGRAYTFKDALASADDVQIGANAEETLENLRHALSLTGSAGSNYGTGTAKNSDLTADSPADGLMLFHARAQGTAANAYAVSASFTDTANEWDGSTFSGGSARVPRLKKVELLIAAAQFLDTRWGPRFRGRKVDEDQALEWPRYGAEDDSNYLYDCDSIPEQIKKAQAELAFAQLDEDNPQLAPNVTEPAPVIKESVKAGPVGQSVEYGAGGNLPDGLGRHFGNAELLLRQFVEPPGRIWRA